MQLQSHITSRRILSAFLIFMLLFLLTNHEFFLDLTVNYHRGKYKSYYTSNVKLSPIKFILHWTDYYMVFENNKHIFPSLGCSVNNCHFTKNRMLLGKDYSKFHVIMFDDCFLKLDGKYDKYDFPVNRSHEQLYVYTSIESPTMKPACELHSDNFFNWTFTFRFDSTIPWYYFVVHNRSGHVIAPSKTVVWEQSTKDLSNDIKKILHRKNKTAMWLVSNCQAHSLRDDYLSDLQEHLYHYNLHIDVFGGCSNKACGDECEDLIKNNYYFYMAFENSISEDYVSEKVLHGYNNYAIPIVFGGANYTRFLPPDSYINANEYNPYILATKMKEIIDNPKLYESYFRWINLYKIRGMTSGWRTLLRSPYHPLCDFCAKLNDPSFLKNTPAIKNFRLWWNHGPAGMKWCLPPSLSNDEQGGIYILPTTQKLEESTTA